MCEDGLCMRPKRDFDRSKPLFAGGEDDGRGVEDLLNKTTLIDCFKTQSDVVKLAYSPFRGILFDLWLEWLSHNRAMRRCCSSCSSRLRRGYSTQSHLSDSTWILIFSKSPS